MFIDSTKTIFKNLFPRKLNQVPSDNWKNSNVILSIYFGVGQVKNLKFF